jgi:hypothetical protein
MPRVSFQPRFYHGYMVFPMNQIQFFTGGKESQCSDNEHFRFCDKYFWVNPKTLMLESFATGAEVKNAVDRAIDGSN